MKRETFSRKDTAVYFLRQAASGKVQQAYEHTTDDFITIPTSPATRNRS
jgi:hypothetical protein